MRSRAKATMLPAPEPSSFDNSAVMSHNLPHESLEALSDSLAGQAREFQEAADYAGDGGGTGESGAAAVSRVVGWMEERGKLIPEARFESFGPPISNSTSEHEVWFDEASQRAIKRTWAGVYGEIPSVENGKVGRRNATLAEYLHRMALQIAVFGSDLKFEGIAVSEKPSMIIGQAAGEPSAVVSQEWISAADPAAPLPSMREIGEFMIGKGFSPAQGSFYGWIRPDGVAAIDAKPDNFVKTASGVVPIDLQMALFDPEEMRLAEWGENR